MQKRALFRPAAAFLAGKRSKSLLQAKRICAIIDTLRTRPKIAGAVPKVYIRSAAVSKWS